MAIRNILRNDLILFGGKGHSLGDCLGQEIGDEITRVEWAENLYALEVSAEKTLDRFKQDYRREMLRLLETSAGMEHLTRRERENLLSLPVRGADELVGLTLSNGSSKDGLTDWSAGKQEKLKAGEEKNGTRANTIS